MRTIVDKDGGKGMRKLSRALAMLLAVVTTFTSMPVDTIAKERIIADSIVYESESTQTETETESESDLYVMTSVDEDEEYGNVPYLETEETTENSSSEEITTTEEETTEELSFELEIPEESEEEFLEFTSDEYEELVVPTQTFEDEFYEFGEDIIDEEDLEFEEFLESIGMEAVQAVKTASSSDMLAKPNSKDSVNHDSEERVINNLQANTWKDAPSKSVLVAKGSRNNDYFYGYQYSVTKKNNEGKSYTVGNCTGVSMLDLLHRRRFLEFHNDSWKDYDIGTNTFSLPGSTSQNTSPFSTAEKRYTVSYLSYGSMGYGKSKEEVIKCFRDVLDAHPEGVLLYLVGSYNKAKEKYEGSHAVLLTYYKIEGGQTVFYCTDPVNVRDDNFAREGSFKLQDSWLVSQSKYYGGGTASYDNCLNAIGAGRGKYEKGCNARLAVISESKYPASNSCTSHRFASNHCCSICGEINQTEITSFTGKGYYKVKSNVYSKKYPYTDEKNSGYKLTIGQSVQVVGAYKNSYGNIWYKVKEPADYPYIYSEHLEKNTDIKGTLTKVGFSIPDSTYIPGKPFGISGQIEASNAKMKKLTCYFRNEDTKSQYQITKDKTIKSADQYSLNIKTYCDSVLLFGKLSSGKYRYIISVTYEDLADGNKQKTQNLESGLFEIKSKSSATPAISVKAPAISVSEVEGGKSVKIEQITSGATLYYTVNGKSKSSDKESESFTIKEKTTIVAYSKKSGKESEKKNQTIDVTKVSTPKISASISKGVYRATITDSTSGCRIYYSIDGGAYKEYKTPITITKTTKIAAKATKKGCVDSAEATGNISVTIPDKPSVVRDSKADIACGNTITAHWKSDNKAADYLVTVYKNDEKWKQETVKAEQYTFVTDKAPAGQYDGHDIYKVTVKAHNSMGYSSESAGVTSNVHYPVVVRFLNEDNAVLAKQVVNYGGSAVKQTAPKKKGYTFNGWVGSYSKVTESTDVKAEYTINEYEVEFLDSDGVRSLGKQIVLYDTAVNLEQYKDSVTLKNAGYKLVGWDIVYAKENDSNMDLTHIDSDMRLKAVTSWGNESLPVAIENLKVTPNLKGDEVNGFVVNCDISTSSADYRNVRVIISLLSKSEGAYKLINSNMVTLELDPDTTKTPLGNTLIVWDQSCKADRVEVSVVNLDGASRTGGLVAKTVYKDLNIQDAAIWSEWYTESDFKKKFGDAAFASASSKTQYRYHDDTKSTVKTTSSTPDSGYTYSGNTSVSYGSWSSWTTAKKTATSTLQVESKTESTSTNYNEYRYGAWTNGSNRHFCKQLGKNLYGGTWNTTYTAWSTTRYSHDSDKSLKWGYCPHTSKSAHGHIGMTSEVSGGNDYWTRYTVASRAYYWEESRTQTKTTSTTYYRSRTKTTYYEHYKWTNGKWSSWQDAKVSGSETSTSRRVVETRKLYRYKFPVSTDVSTGTVLSTQGSLNNPLYTGKNALMMVYKTKNTDPTESQLEYIGGCTLGSNGSYDMKYITREDLSDKTSDFVVALAVEGNDGLVNIDLKPYERPSFTVNFNAMGERIDSQEVVQGADAEVPDAPVVEGYDFAGWSRTSTCITRDIEVNAVYIPKTYAVAFVDFINQNVSIKRVECGNTVSYDEDDIPTHEGYIFDSWEGLGETVTDDMVVTAKWIPKTYTVTFYGLDGETIISEQEVEYGGDAVAPDSPYLFGMDFLSWDINTPWWNVKSDVAVHPLANFWHSAYAPMYEVELTEDGEERVNLVAGSGENIYFTLDGSTPNPEVAVEYTGELAFSSEHYELIEDDSFEPIMESDTEEDEKIGDDEDSYIEDGVTYYYDADTELILDDFMHITALSDAEGENTSEIVSYDVSYDSAIDGETDNTPVKIAMNEVKVGLDETVKVGVCLDREVELKNFAIAIEADRDLLGTKLEEVDEYELQPVISRGRNCASGDIWVDTDENISGWVVHWTSTQPTSRVGKLFDITLVNQSGDPLSACPITVSYLPDETYGIGGEPVFLEENAYITINDKEQESDAFKYHVYLDYDETLGMIETEHDAELKMVEVWEGDDVELRIIPEENCRIEDVICDGESLGVTDTISLPDVLENHYVKVVFAKEDNAIGDISREDFAKYCGGNVEDIPQGLWVAGIDDEVEYTGKAIKFTGFRVYEGKKLISSKDYTVKYFNNVKAAKTDAVNSKGQSVAPMVTITGKGNYVGTVTKAFEIKPVDIDDAIAKDESIVLQFNPRVSQKPVPVVTWGGKQLVEKRDYVVTYISQGIEISECPSSVGTYQIVLTGNGNYTGTKLINFSIKQEKLISSVKINGLSKTVKYTGDPVTIDELSLVTKSGVILSEGEDYELEYSDNTYTGKATITISGIGEYTGTRKASFNIKGEEISKASVEGVEKSYVYTGEEIKPDRLGEVTVVSKDGFTSLEPERDYDVSYANNVNVGTAMIKFTGQHTSQGQKTVKYKIVPANLADGSESVNVRYTEKVEYRQGGVKIRPVVKFNGKLLYEGKDYTLSFANNKKPGLATVKIKGKGNFKGTIQENFEITPADISNESVYRLCVPNLFDTLRTKIAKHKVVLYEGKTALKNGRDYTVTYTYYSGENRGKVVGSRDILSEGTSIKAVINGNGKYTGQVSSVFTVETNDISDGTITIEKQTYTGSEIVPGEADIEFIVDGRKLILGEDYDIVICTNNVKIGKATITFVGKGAYAGTKSAKFTIKSKKFEW